MQFLPKKPPKGIVFDSSFGESIDTVLALGLLHGLEAKNQARIAALSTTKSNLKSAQLCDVIEKFYLSATTGQFAAFFQGLPVGMAVDGKLANDTPVLTGALDRKDSEGKAVYAPRIHNLNDTAIAEVLIRNALMAQYDGNAAIVTAGPASTLARLLALSGAKELVASKVSLLAMAAGEFPQGKPDPNMTADLVSAKRVLAEWPTPMVFCGREIGREILFPGESIEKDFAYNAAHPIADAYRASHNMPYDAPTCAMAAALYAARPDDGYFRTSEPGTVSLSDDGRLQFRPASDGKHRYLIADPAQKERLIRAYRELASAKPVPRSFRRQQQQEQKPEEKDKLPADKKEQKNP